MKTIYKLSLMCSLALMLPSAYAMNIDGDEIDEITDVERSIPDSPYAEKQLPLLQAIADVNIEKLTALLQDSDIKSYINEPCGNQLNARIKGQWPLKPRHGEAPLHAACRNCHIDIVKLLLDNGADINALTAYTHSVFAVAAEGSIGCMYREPQKNWQKLLHLLKARGADINHTSAGGGTALALLASHEAASPTVLEEFIKLGANPTIQERKYGSTALSQAQDVLDYLKQANEWQEGIANFTTIVAMLKQATEKLKQPAQPSGYFDKSEHANRLIAQIKYTTHELNSLLQHPQLKEFINEPCTAAGMSFRKTALQVAAAKGDFCTLKLLLETGLIDSNLPSTKIALRMALHNAVTTKDCNQAQEQLQFLVKYIDINAPDRYEHTILHDVAVNTSTPAEILNMLLSLGAKPELANKNDVSLIAMVQRLTALSSDSKKIVDRGQAKIRLLQEYAAKNGSALKENNL